MPLRQLQRGSYTAVSAASALLRLSVRPRRLGCVSFYTSVHPSATKSIHYVLTVRMHNRFLFHVRDRDDVKLERRCNHHDQCNHRNETAHASVRSGLATWLLLGLRCGEVAVDHLTVLAAVRRVRSSLADAAGRQLRYGLAARDRVRTSFLTFSVFWTRAC